MKAQQAHPITSFLNLIEWFVFIVKSWEWEREKWKWTICCCEEFYRQFGRKFLAEDPTEVSMTFRWDHHSTLSKPPFSSEAISTSQNPLDRVSLATRSQTPGKCVTESVGSAKLLNCQPITFLFVSFAALCLHPRKQQIVLVSEDGKIPLKSSMPT